MATESKADPMFKCLRAAACIAGALCFFACTKTQENLSPLATRGRAVYQANCIACHNMDPRQPGSLGPEIYGSSRALIEARVMRAEYPAGYTPKRQTHTMAALPQLSGDLDSIFAYLNGK